MTRLPEPPFQIQMLDRPVFQIYVAINCCAFMYLFHFVSCMCLLWVSPLSLDSAGFFNATET